MGTQKDLCACGLKRWMHSIWATRSYREAVERAHIAHGLPIDHMYEFIEAAT